MAASTEPGGIGALREQLQELSGRVVELERAVSRHGLVIGEGAGAGVKPSKAGGSGARSLAGTTSAETDAQMMTNGTAAVAMQSSVSGQAIVGSVAVVGREAAIAFGSPDAAPVASIHSPGGSTVAVEGDLVVGGDLVVRGEPPTPGTIVPVAPGSAAIASTRAVSLTADGRAEAGWGLDPMPSMPGPAALGAVSVAQHGGTAAILFFSDKQGVAMAGLVRVSEAGTKASVVSGAVPVAGSAQWTHVSAAPAMGGTIAIAAFTTKANDPRFAIARASPVATDSTLTVPVGAFVFGTSSVASKQEAAVIASLPGTNDFIVVQVTSSGSVAFSGSLSGTPAAPAFVASVSPLTTLTATDDALPSLVSVNSASFVYSVFAQDTKQTSVMLLSLEGSRRRVTKLASDSLPTLQTSRDAVLARVDDGMALIAYRVQEQGYAVKVSALSVGTVDAPAMRLAAPVSVHPGTGDVSALRMSLAAASGGPDQDTRGFERACGESCARRGRFVLGFRDGAAVGRVVDGLVAPNGSAVVLGKAGVVGDPGVSTEVSVTSLPVPAADRVLVTTMAPSQDASGTGIAVLRAGPTVAGVTRSSSQPVSGGSYAAGTALAASSQPDEALYSLGDAGAAPGNASGFPRLRHVVGVVTGGTVEVEGASSGSVFEGRGAAQSGPLVPGAAYAAARDGSLVAYGASSEASSLQLVGVAVSRSRLSLAPAAFLSGSNLGIVAASGAEQPGAGESAQSGSGAGGGGVPVGTMVSWAGDVSNPTSVPVGWLPCDGSSLAKQDYPALFAVLGCAFSTGPDCTGGGDVFSLPDSRRRVVVGATLDSAAWDAAGSTHRGAQGGSATHVLSTSEVPAHAHPVGMPGLFTEEYSSARHPSRSYLFGSACRVGGTITNSQARISADTSKTFDSGLVGGGGAHNNVQPYVAVSFIIKV